MSSHKRRTPHTQRLMLRLPTIKPYLLTKWEKEWLRQVLETLPARKITPRKRQVFLTYLKEGSFAATARYIGISNDTVAMHVAAVLMEFEWDQSRRG